jgi:acyl dehydratase
MNATAPDRPEATDMDEASKGIPAAVQALIGVAQHAEESSFPIEMAYVYNTCAAVQNGNPLYWDEAVAREITHGWITPPTMMSVWFRPHYWVPGASGERLALQLHFDLKRLFDLPEAIIAGNETVFGVPVRPGDRLRAHQVLRSVSAVKTTRVGVGRFWVIDLECHNQHGEFVGRDTYDCFGYRRPAA